MNVWRIGSNWGGIDILPIFKKYKLAFAGSEVESLIKQVKENDLVAITKGQTIVGIGKAIGFIDLAEIDKQYTKDYDDVIAIKLNPLFFANNYKQIDFGIYDGTGKQFHQARKEYINQIKNKYFQAYKFNMENEYVELLKSNKNLILTGAPGTGKTYLANKIAKEIIVTPIVREDIDNVAFEDFRNSEIDQNEILSVDEAWSYWKNRILSSDFNIDDYANRLQNISDEAVKDYGGYLMNFLERTSSVVYGSSKPGNAFNYGIKMNEDRTYSVYGKENESISKEEAEMTFDESIKGWLKKLLIAPLEEKINLIESGNNLIKATQLLRKIVVLEHPTKILSIYQDITILNGYKYFINGSETSYFKQNIDLLDRLFEKFKLEKTKFNAKKFAGFVWQYFNKKADENIAELKENVVETYFNEHKAFVQFHPSYDYTDFFDGLRPVKKVGETNIGFELKNGSFKEFCLKAKKSWEEDEKKESVFQRKFVFIIDEINRAEISKVFGELFFAIDPGYRGKKGRVKTQYSNIQSQDTFFSNINDDQFYVPENVYIIGTMNDIDRSVESFDFAMRRRFAWKEIKAIDRIQMWDGNIDAWKDEAKKRMLLINKAIENINGLSSSYHIGPAYFLKLKDFNGDFAKLWDINIGVIIKEYLRGMPDAEKSYSDIKSIYENPIAVI